MSDLFLDEIVQPGPGSPGERSRSARRADRVARDRKRKRRRRRNFTAFVIVLLVLGGIGLAVVKVVLPILDNFGSGTDDVADDYPGPGTGEVDVVIPAGATGTDMAQILLEADVVASARAFTSAFATNPDAPSIQPGTYRLLLQMRGVDAVAALLNPEYKVEMQVTIPEGFRLSQILERLAATTTLPIEDFQAAMADTASTGLPAEAGGNYEGWLFPATYTFQPDDTPTTMIAAMVTQTVATLDSLGVQADQRQAVLIKASLVERESPDATASPMMARAIQNRLDRGMILQIDATVAYGAGITDGLTQAMLDDASNPYNTYVHTGLPPTPIASPGAASIQAILAPAEGDWLYWCTINPDTKETRFATTLAEHRENVALLRQWEAENPSDG